ncbi:hypothetical protein G7Y89_g9794 [Cudoniella acicularis]|uniref:Peptidase S8/S53 domain-containing protein n=1 Tax=Cudoniella acicularis TaxID=354080 RepID=A0A8H4RDZ3_9HELO|nr:hypothetical protein G7Y89_g9794 [Cudoniella acicularis]
MELEIAEASLLETPNLVNVLEAAYDAGLPIAAAARNQNQEATGSPSVYPEYAMCVAACDRGYQKWIFDNKGSNYGSLVDVIAPGQNIYGAIKDYSKKSLTIKSTMSGTSQAAAMVAGIMATYVGYENILSNASTVFDRVQENAFLALLAAFQQAQQPGTCSLIPWSTEQPVSKYLKQPLQPIPKAPQRTTITGHDPSEPSNFSLPPPSTTDYEGDVELDDSTAKSSGQAAVPSPSQAATISSSQPSATTTQSCTSVSNAQWISRRSDKRSQYLLRRRRRRSRPPTPGFVQADCVALISGIRDNCYNNNPSNPMNWNRGGSVAVTNTIPSITFQMTPLATRYIPGPCGLHVTEDGSWVGSNLLDSSRTYTFSLVTTVKDGAGNTIGGSFPAAVGCGDSNPYQLPNVYYDTLVLTPEASGDYIKFSIGGQQWKSRDAQCNEGGYDGL